MRAIRLWALAWAYVAKAALDVDFSSSSSIKAAAKLVATDLMTYYEGDQPGKTPGILPGPPPHGPYYWWNAGAMWGTLIDHWSTTGDTRYNDEIERSLVFQSGERRNYEPLNWTGSLGNDDQSFWAFSAMLAAELKFQNPPPEDPQWLALAQAVFNRQSMPKRHDDVCGGGMRWQIPPINEGYDYKNSIANGCYFNLGARLARYTGNDTYARLAERIYDWVVAVNYIDDNFNVFDGAHTYTNCTDISPVQFSYNAAVFMQGFAFMYNHTGDAKWKTRLDGMIETSLEYFFNREGHRGIMFETACEVAGANDASTCNTDMVSFKGFMHRWLATVIKVAPHTRDRIYPVLLSSAQAAVKVCTGGITGRMCGFKWSTGTFDGNIGAGQQMNVLGALSSVLVDFADDPVTEKTGGTSRSDPLAGTDPDPPALLPMETRDRIGAGILTAAVSVGAVVVVAWMCSDVLEHKKL